MLPGMLRSSRIGLAARLRLIDNICIVSRATEHTVGEQGLFETSDELHSGLYRSLDHTTFSKTKLLKISPSTGRGSLEGC
jgi:hypothetical protein